MNVATMVKNWGSSGGERGETASATLRIRAGAGQGLRRRAKSVTPDPGHPGWDLVTVRFADEKWYADYVASFGPDVVVIEPPDLRDAVIAKLKGVLT
jgi:proteasome accessory factor B